MKTNPQDAIISIRSLYPSFHKVEKKIANFVLSNRESIVYLPIHNMAKELNVAESSIVRFCKIIGFDGFKQLKINLAKNLESPERIIYEDISDGDSREDIVRKVFFASTKTLEESLGMLDMNEFYEAVESILKAKRIEFYGVGTSLVIAQDAYYRFMRIGLPVYAPIDPHMSRASAATMDSDSLAIGISYMGKSKDTVDTLRIAKERGAKTVCITCFPSGAITKISDIKLILSTRESKMMREAISSRIAQIALIDSLYVAVALENPDAVIEKIENLSDILDSLRVK